MRYAVLCLILVAACAPAPIEEVPEPEPVELGCVEGTIPQGDGCCIDADGNGICDADEPEEVPEPVVPYYLFHISYAPGEPPEDVTIGEPFTVTLDVENGGNVMLEAGQTSVKLLFASPQTLGLTLSEMRTQLPGDIVPGETQSVTWDITIDDDFQDSFIMLESEFCYQVNRWDEKCTRTRKSFSVG